MVILLQPAISNTIIITTKERNLIFNLSDSENLQVHSIPHIPLYNPYAGKVYHPHPRRAKYFGLREKKDRPLFSKEKPAFEANSSIDDLHNYYTLWSLPQAPIYVALWEKRL